MGNEKEIQIEKNLIHLIFSRVMPKLAHKQDYVTETTSTDFSNSYGQRITIVIPAFNEERRIGNTIRELERTIPDILEILVIFDGNDNTPSVALDAGKKVRVVEFSERLGQGGAIFEGFKLARGEVVCFVDADGASPWYEVKRVCSLISKEVTAVFGSRWAKGAKIGNKENLRNIIGGRVYHYLAYAILGIKEKDSFCGLKAFTSEVAKELAKRITIKDRTFNIAISYNLKLMGVKPMETGIVWSHKGGSQLPVGIKTVAMMFLTLIGLKIAHTPKSTKFRSFALEFRKMIEFY